MSYYVKANLGVEVFVQELEREDGGGNINIILPTLYGEPGETSEPHGTPHASGC